MTRPLTPRRVRRRTAVATVAATSVALATAATAATAAPRPSAPRSTVTCSTAASGLRTCAGALGASSVLVEVPARWNGALVLWSHGYRFARASRTAGITVTRDAVDAPVRAHDQLLAAGYALAGSSYARNGWAVSDGVKADEDLLRWVRASVRPQRVLAAGESLGGLITQTFAETHPGAVQGVALQCAAVSGDTRQWDHGLAVETAIRELFAPGLRTSGFRSYAEAERTFAQGLAALKAAASASNPDGIAKLLALAAVSDFPTQSPHYDGHDLASQVGAVVENAANTFALGVLGRWELEQRMRGRVSTDVRARYDRGVSTADLSAYAANGFGPDLLRAYAIDLQGATRTVLRGKDAAARARLERDPQPKGLIRVPTLSMHTTVDPLVGPWNQTVLAAEAQKTRTASRLVDLWVAPPARYDVATGTKYGAGHCNFTPQELLTEVQQLDRWVTTGAKPSVAQVVDAARAAGEPTDGGLLYAYRGPQPPQA